MVQTIYQSLMTASLDTFGEYRTNALNVRHGSITLAQHPAPVRLDPLAYKWGIA